MAHKYFECQGKASHPPFQYLFRLQSSCGHQCWFCKLVASESRLAYFLHRGEEWRRSVGKVKRLPPHGAACASTNCDGRLRAGKELRVGTNVIEMWTLAVFLFQATALT